MPIYQKQGMKSYIDEEIVRYRYYEKKNAYQLILVFAGSFSKKGSEHSFSWSGKQYSNDKTILDLMSVDEKPDHNGFYLIDLH